ncbi:hypothetical protein MN608_03378 [Microdochium nivale]|nr:hypothetical protein MN608_03378 [Microdochium nivale]
MGFLNILLKRQRVGTDAGINEASFLKAQPYETTTASSPPILGTVPVPGNGSNPILIAANQQRLQVQLNTGNASSRRLPVSRLRSSTISRPGTAGSSSQLGAPGRSGTGSSPSLASKPELQRQNQAPKKNGPPYKLPARSEDPLYEFPSKPWLDSETPKRNSLIARTGTLSSSSSAPITMTNHKSSPSLGSQFKTHVDLLDATIKPLDFYDRVKATGAKTYGEDVADRNQTQPPFLLQARGDASPHDAAGPRKRHSMGYGLRTSSPQPISPPEQDRSATTRDSNLIAKRKAVKAARRQSMPLASDFSSDITAGHANGAVPFPLTLREKAAVMAKNELAIIRATATMSKSDRVRLDATLDSPTAPVSPPDCLVSAVTMDRVQEPSARVASSSKTPHDTRPSTSNSHIEQGLVESLLRHNRKESWKSTKQQRPRNTSGASLTASSIKQFDQETSIPDRSSSLRNWSMTSGSVTVYTHDYESNPFRPQSSHTMNTSIDLTPFSSVSKFHSPTQALSTSPAEVAIADYRRATPEPASRFQTLRRSPLGPGTKSVEANLASVAHIPYSDEFHIDDYISSDDSFGSPKRNRGDEEKHLLFSDQAFGHTFQLPGISAPLRQEQFPPSPVGDGQTLCLSAFNDFSSYGDSPSFGQVSALRVRTPQPPAPRLTGSRGREYNFSVPTYRDHDAVNGDDSGVDADSEDEWSMDIPMRRSAPNRHHYQTSPARQYEDHHSRAANSIYSPPASTRPRHGRHQQPRTRHAQRTHDRDY